MHGATNSATTRSTQWARGRAVGVAQPLVNCEFPLLVWRGGRVAEGGGLLNRYRALKPYRGFESPLLRARFARMINDQ